MKLNMSEITIVSAKSCHSKIIWVEKRPITRKMSNNNEKYLGKTTLVGMKKILLNKSRKLVLR